MDENLRFIPKFIPRFRQRGKPCNVFVAKVTAWQRGKSAHAILFTKRRATLEPG